MNQNRDKEQYNIVLNASEKDIKNYKETLTVIGSYEKYRDILSRSIETRMKANGFKELGGLELVEEKVFDNIEVGKLLGLFLNQELAKSVVVTVNVEATEKNLRETYGFTDVAIQPFMKVLREKLTTQKERLVVVK